MVNTQPDSVSTLMMLLLLVGALSVAVQAGGHRVERHDWSPVADADSDRDGIPDLFDLCEGKNNIGQPDRDGDLLRDGCDLSPNGDGRLHVTYGRRTYVMDGKPDPTILSAR